MGHGRAVKTACGSVCCSVRGQGRLLEKAICKQNAQAPTVVNPELKSREFIQSVGEGTVTCLPQPGFVPK